MMRAFRKAYPTTKNAKTIQPNGLRTVTSRKGETKRRKPSAGCPRKDEDIVTSQVNKTWATRKTQKTIQCLRSNRIVMSRFYSPARFLQGRC